MSLESKLIEKKATKPERTINPRTISDSVVDPNTLYLDPDTHYLPPNWIRILKICPQIGSGSKPFHKVTWSIVKKKKTYICSNNLFLAKHIFWIYIKIMSHEESSELRGESASKAFFPSFNCVDPDSQNCWIRINWDPIDNTDFSYKSVGSQTFAYILPS